ncbi:MAG: hypothetical protein ACTHWH_08735 [Marinobacter sp.]
MNNPKWIGSALALLLVSVFSRHGWAVDLDYHQKLSFGSAYADYETLRETDKGSFEFKYEGFANWDFPDENWPQWSLFLRPWLSYRSDGAVPFLNQETETSAQVDGFYGELWEFVATRQNLWGNPEISLSAGRQQFSDEYGFWWDDSLESLKLNLASTRNRGFVALASRQFLYNTDDNELSSDQSDIFYLLSEYHYSWSPDQWFGLRLLGQNDHSPSSEIRDEGDFTGGTVGIELEGENVGGNALNVDYNFQLAGTVGQFKHVNAPGFTNESFDTRGWLFFTEVGNSFADPSGDSRLALRFALTDSPDTPYSGYFQRDIQSSRASRFSNYNTGLSGAVINARTTNLMLTGLLGQHELSPRSQVKLSFYDLRRRNADIDVSQTIGLEYAESSGKHIGNIVEAQYDWSMFPYAIDNRHLTFNVLFTLGYFHGGDALQKNIKDYRASLDMKLRY